MTFCCTMRHLISCQHDVTHTHSIRKLSEICHFLPSSSSPDENSVFVTNSVAFASAAAECKRAQRRRCCPWLLQKRAPTLLLAVATACRMRRPPNQHVHLEEQSTSAGWFAQKKTVPAKVSCMHSHLYYPVHVSLLYAPVEVSKISHTNGSKPDEPWENLAFPTYLQSEVDDFCQDWDEALQVQSACNFTYRTC